MVLLVAMAYDRYIMQTSALHDHHESRTCTVLWGLLGHWHLALSQSPGIHNRSSFVDPNKVDNFFCDLPLVIKLACLDTYVFEILVLTNSGLLSLVCFLPFAHFLHYHPCYCPSQAPSGGTSRALSTLSAHITVVVLFFGPLIFIYIWPFESFTIDNHLCVFYCIHSSS